jgi:hypothetical protein
VGLERGPLSLVCAIEELLGRNNSGSGLEIREYCRRDPSSWPRGTLYPQKLALTSLSSVDHSVGIVRSRTKATKSSLGNVCVKIPQVETICGVFTSKQICLLKEMISTSSQSHCSKFRSVFHIPQIMLS